MSVGAEHRPVAGQTSGTGAQVGGGTRVATVLSRPHVAVVLRRQQGGFDQGACEMHVRVCVSCHCAASGLTRNCVPLCAAVCRRSCCWRGRVCCRRNVSVAVQHARAVTHPTHTHHAHMLRTHNTNRHLAGTGTVLRPTKRWMSGVQRCWGCLLYTSDAADE